MSLDILRHSAAHIMAAAVERIYGDVKFGIGPAIHDGFYYDFDLGHKLTEDDFARIEEEMRSIVKAALPFVRKEMSREDAMAFFEKKGQVYKCELISDIEDEIVSIYELGNFVDLCKGPHVDNSSEVSAFKLLSVAGAYWRGSEKNKMLQRIYGTAFHSEKELKSFLFQREEAKKRDHRLLGKELDLFSFSEEAPGFPFFHDKGFKIYNELIKFWREIHYKNGYLEVKTPIIMREDLWIRSGHYDHYKDHMYFTEIDGAMFAVKPMNCPGGLLIYKTKKHSYREFPIKMAELGQVHRHELSGVLHGLFRVKTFTIDDAHIFCLEDQIEEEVKKAIGLILSIYKTFGFEDVSLELSTRPEDSMGSDEIWEKATSALEMALRGSVVSFKVNEGDGAFYGPKIDFHIKDSLGRSWQCGTVQLDFSMPERFELEYVGSDGNTYRPVMIHRAAYGSIERFMGILIEHYGGKFPLWLSPLQVRVMAISDKCEGYAEKVYKELFDAGFRVDIDLRNSNLIIFSYIFYQNNYTSLKN